MQREDFIAPDQGASSPAIRIDQPKWGSTMKFVSTVIHMLSPVLLLEPTWMMGWEAKGTTLDDTTFAL